MQFSFDVSSTNTAKPAAPLPQGSSLEVVADLLRQLVDVQREQHQLMGQILEITREQLGHSRMVHQENMARWRNLMARWEKDYPELSAHCKKIYPAMEKAYLQMIENLAHDVADQGDEPLDTDFALQEFLDRHGMRVSQLGHLLGIVGPLSEAGPEVK
jgi:hypothetical protein